MKKLLNIPFRRLALLGLAVVILSAGQCPRREPSLAPAVYVLALNDPSHIQTFNPSFVPIRVENATNGQYIGQNMVFDLTDRSFSSVPALFLAGTNNDVKVVDLKLDVATPDVTRSIPVGGNVTYIGHCGGYCTGLPGNGVALLAVIGGQQKVVALDTDSETVTRTYTLPATSAPLKAIGAPGQIYAISAHPDPALYVLDAETGESIAKLPLERGVSDIVQDPTNFDPYVSNLVSNLVYVIETGTFTVKKRINIQSPYALGVSKDALFVTGLSQFGNGRLTKFTLGDHRQLQTVETGAMPMHLSVDLDRERLYVSNHNSPFVTQVTFDMVKQDNVPVPFVSPGATAIDTYYQQ